MCNPHDDRRLPAITRRHPAKSSASAGNFFESGTLLLRKRGRRPNDAPPPRSAPSPDGQRSPRAGTEPRCAASTPANTAPCLPRHAAGVSKTAAGARIAGRSIRFMDSSAAPMTGSRAARPRRRRARPTLVPAADSPVRGLSKRWGWLSEPAWASREFALRPKCGSESRRHRRMAVAEVLAQRESRRAWARLPRAETWPRTRVVLPVAATRCCFTLPTAFFAFAAIFRSAFGALRTAFFGRGGMRHE
jgi:hypothetical protein